MATPARSSFTPTRTACQPSLVLAGKQFSDSHRAVDDLRQQIITSWSTETETEADDMLRSVDEAAAEQRRLLLGLDDDQPSQ